MLPISATKKTRQGKWFLGNFPEYYYHDAQYTVQAEVVRKSWAEDNLTPTDRTWSSPLLSRHALREREWLRDATILDIVFSRCVFGSPEPRPADL